MNVHRRILALIEPGEPFAVALVLGADGSTPRETGVKAVIGATGRIWGTLGGGVVEAEAQRQAVEACASGRPMVLEVDLEGTEATGHEPVCGGRMRVLVDPTARKDAAAYAQAASAVEERTRGALLTMLRVADETSTEVRWCPEPDFETLAFPDPEAVRACLAAEQARLFRAADETGLAVEVLVEPVLPNPLLLIAGGGHIGQALADQAVMIGFDVTVLDDRPEFTDPARFPEGVVTRCGDVAEELAACPLGSDTYVVIVTRGHQHDAAALRACLRRPAAYIGMIGSRRKVALLRQSFIESGWATAQEFDRVYAPIGLDIGAETVPEIATAIAAQLISVRRRGRAETMPRDAVGR